MCSDITERKQAEERFRMAVEAAPAAMIMVDERGMIVLINALTEQLLGYTRQELVGQPIDHLVPRRLRGRHPEYRAGFLTSPGQRPMGAGRELYALRKDGSEVAVEIGLSPVATEDGIFVLAAVSDITERKEIEKQHANLLVREQAARADLERASRLKDEFLAVLSHELRTPLNAVLGYTQLLRAGALPAERMGHALDAIQRNAQAQARLVESLLDLSRVMAGKLELNLERLDLFRVVDTALDVIRPEAEARGIALDVTAPSDEITLLGDASRLQQVFWNLLSNAVKFTPRGGRIAVSVIASGDDAVITIADNGQGINAEFLPHVFDRFKQADSHKGRSSDGLGLGLALVREMVHAHGGNVVADSPGMDRGSTFTVTLPASMTTAGEALPVDTVTGRETVESLPELQILIVDDESDVRDLLALLVESRGASAVAVASAAEALDAIEARRPDLLLADLRMPDEDGYSLIRKLRAREREQHVGRLPAIAVTAYASAADRDQAIAAGYDGHIAKPIDPDVLTRTIAKVASMEKV
jgi:PAS domain S-box-containing protein